MLRGGWKAALPLAGLLVLANSALAQTTVAAGVFGAFSQSTSSSSDGITQTPANAAGVIVELRHLYNPLLGFDAAYSWNRANQTFTQTTPTVCGLQCSGSTSSTEPVPANANEISIAWVGSFRLAGFTPFVLAGGGVLFNTPTTNVATDTICSNVAPLCAVSSKPTNSSTTGVFVYGAGVDWEILPHLGLRVQYRGHVNRARGVARSFTTAHAFLQTTAPMVGAFFRF